MREHFAAATALLCLLLLAATLLVDTRCFVALLAAIALFALCERGLPLPMDTRKQKDSGHG